MIQLLTNCEVFDGQQLHTNSAVVIDGESIAGIVAVGDTPAGIDTVVDINGNLLTPGLIDLQVNGGGGMMFNNEPSVDALVVIGAAHRSFGTTAYLPTLISDNADVMKRGIEAVATSMGEGHAGVVGIHLEGPHLNPEFRGVHDAARMRPIDENALALLTSLADGCTLVTIAPETVPADAIRQLCNSGIIVFGGHSAASYEDVRQALDAGLSGFTHLFNAMTPLKSRAPGMVGAALDDEDSYVGIIADGHHVHPATLRVAIKAKSAGKVVLVTDAMPTVGASDKTFELNGETIRAVGGCCLTPDGTLAGSDIGLIHAVKNASQFGGVDRYEALRMASSYPAEAIGLADTLGFIRPGYRANLIELDSDFNVVRSWIGGRMAEHG